MGRCGRSLIVSLGHALAPSATAGSLEIADLQPLWKDQWTIVGQTETSTRDIHLPQTMQCRYNRYINVICMCLLAQRERPVVVKLEV